MEQFRHFFRISKHILCWIIAVFPALMALAFFPSLASVFWLLAAALLLSPLNRFRDRFLKKRVWIPACIVLIVLAFAFVPAEKMAAEPPEASVATVERLTEPAAEPAPVAIPEAEEAAPSPAPTAAPTPAPTPTPTPTPAPTAAPTPAFLAGSKLELHVIDVGQGDAILVVCDGHAMLVDGGGVDDGQRVVAYLKKQKATQLDVVVSTHPHEDHVGGLAGVMHACSVQRVCSPVENYDSEPFKNFKKYVERKKLQIQTVLTGDGWELGSARVTVLAANTSRSADNDASVVLKIVHGDVSYLLTGDAGKATEQALLRSGYALESTVLKVGHHGGDDATGYAFLREVMPAYAVISVGKDNPYGHPTEAVLSRLSDAEAKVRRTDVNGNTVFSDDGKTLSVQVAREATDRELLTLQPWKEPGQESGAADRAAGGDTVSKSYIGNRNSKKFHLPSCRSLPKESNRIYFDTRDQATGEGYTPCQNCDP